MYHSSKQFTSHWTDEVRIKDTACLDYSFLIDKGDFLLEVIFVVAAVVDCFKKGRISCEANGGMKCA